MKNLLKISTIVLAIILINFITITTADAHNSCTATTLFSKNQQIAAQTTPNTKTAIAVSYIPQNEKRRISNSGGLTNYFWGMPVGNLLNRILLISISILLMIKGLWIVGASSFELETD